MVSFRVEDVFRDAGIPQITFVEPAEFTKTRVSLRTPGKGVIVEGPSGIGKTTCIQKAIQEEKLKPTLLSARKNEDLEMIEFLLSCPKKMGLVVIDDFHYLEDSIKVRLTNLLKVLADESREDVKLVLIGINKAGDSLIQLAPDLSNRIDIIHFEKNPVGKIEELITIGEKALNIHIACRDQIIQGSYGSFHIAQVLCKTVCIQQGLLNTSEQHQEITIPYQEVINSQMQDLERRFSHIVNQFVVGNRNRRGGKATYYWLMRWLAESESGVLSMDDAILYHPSYKPSIGQITDNQYITKLIMNHPDISSVLFYDLVSKNLAIEDPKFLFYIKNMDWEQYSRNMGFKSVEDDKQFDFALSFSGENRHLAEHLSALLRENEYTVFYDKDYTADMIGKDLDSYLAGIYSKEAKYVVVFYDVYYPKKFWTAFESEKYKDRFNEDAVIPILVGDLPIMPTDKLYTRAYLSITEKEPVESQINELFSVLDEKMRKS